MIDIDELNEEFYQWGRESKPGVLYHERNQLVAALSKFLPSWLEHHPQKGYWEYVAFIQLPTGQASWFVRKDEAEEFFSHLEIKEGDSWDGHTIEEKYQRLKQIRVVER